MSKHLKKIAVVSSSPIMIMLSNYFMEKGYQVTIFDYKGQSSGAWAWFKDYKEKYKKYLPRYSNAIVPLNLKEEKFIPAMNRKLIKKYKIKIKKTKKKNHNKF